MATAGEVLGAVQALGYGTDTKAAQLTMLNQVQRRILNARRWTFALSSTTKTCTVGSPEVVFDSTLAATQRVDAVRMTGTAGATEPLELEFIEAPVIRQYLHDNSAQAQPRYWSRRGQNIILYPTPDKAYPLTIDTVANAAKAATEADNVVIPDSHIDILVYGLIMQLTFRERDWDGHNMARQMYAELFTEMLAQYGMQQRQQSTHVTSSGQWDMYDPEDAYPWQN